MKQLSLGILISGRLHVQRYVDMILEEHVITYSMGSKYVFMRNNAKLYSADTMDFLQEHGIRTFNRPSLSPNMNIIENL
jgi:hypothetical protein